MCCGNEYHVSAESAQSAATAPRVEKPAPQVVVFRYNGQTPITVVGARTRTRYRFDGPGATAIVDVRDAASLAAIPRLAKL